MSIKFQFAIRNAPKVLDAKTSNSHVPPRLSRTLVVALGSFTHLARVHFSFIICVSRMKIL